MSEDEKTGSDFGRGLCYCLGLFLAHTTVGMWFYAAADHVFELEHEHAPEHLRGRVSWWRDFVLERRDTMVVRFEDAQWAIDEAKALLLEIDRAHGVPVCEARCP